MAIEQSEIQKQYLKRKKWFNDRIGKKVYRNDDSCDCDSCKRIYNEGLVIHDTEHASYLVDIEGISNCDGNPIQYFDTIKERDAFEATLNSNKVNK